MARTDTVFKIGNTDFSDHVISDGSYDINATSVYKAWEDANGREHRDEIRKRIEGGFNMLFHTVEDFQVFNQKYKESASASGLVRISVMNNDDNQVIDIDAYLSFKPVRIRRDDWEDAYEIFKVNVMEW